MSEELATVAPRPTFEMASSSVDPSNATKFGAVRRLPCFFASVASAVSFSVTADELEAWLATSLASWYSMNAKYPNAAMSTTSTTLTTMSTVRMRFDFF